MALFALVILFVLCLVNNYVSSYVVAPGTTVPHIIQGGMGVRISSWKLAQEVSNKGELGVVSGTAMDTIFVRELQDGDKDNSIRRALASFPDQDMAKRALDEYFIEGGKDKMTPYKTLPMWSLKPSQKLLEATVLGNYCEVWLAKHNDDGSPIDGIVGINRLTKIQLPTIPSLFGAMLAGVDYVLMGAGIPMAIPSILDDLSESKDCKLAIDVTGASKDQQIFSTFSPSEFWENAGKPQLAKKILNRPNFIPIVSSVVLAQSMLKRASGKGPTKGIDGFVVELPTAGGHNAPPRGFKYDPKTHSHDDKLNENGEPIYTDKDDVDLLKFLKASSGLPFWMAGSYGRADRFRDVVEIGAAGIQAGTMFALAEESGMDDAFKQKILSQIAQENMEVYTDPAASPTSFPFKVLQLDGTLSDSETYLSRPRACSLGYLREPYVRPDNGKIGFRCASEPIDSYAKKGGLVEATEGRKCLCNALCANAGFPQVNLKKKRNDDDEQEKSYYVEEPLITIGDDVNNCRRFLKQDKESGRWSYSASDVIDYLLSEWKKTSAGESDVNAKEEQMEVV